MHRRSPSDRDDAERRRLARGFVVLSGLTLGLIIVGALVRAHDAGLACPDWPLCHGQIVPSFDLEIAFEWGHRVFAGSISLGLLALGWLALRSTALRAPMTPRLAFAATLLAVQVVFGGLTVLLRLAPWTVGVHLILGNLFCATLAWIALDLHESFGAARPAAAPEIPARARTIAFAVIASLVLQLVLGGWLSSHYAGLACASFPTCDGSSFAPTLRGPVGMHVLHRLNGAVLLASFAVLAVVLRGRGRAGRLAVAGTVLVVLQIAVGAANVWLRLPVAVTGLHTGLAAAIVLATALVLRDARLARAGSFGALAGAARVAEAR